MTVKMNALLNEGEEIKSDFQKYLLALYFCSQTISTVGYGDVSPTNSIERFFYVFLMIAGVIVFTFISATITSLMVNFDN